MFMESSYSELLSEGEDAFLSLRGDFFLDLVMFIAASEAYEATESGGVGKLATAKLSSSSKSSKLSLKNSSSSENETTFCLLSPLYTTLSALVVNATKGLKSSSESDSSKGSKAGRAVCVSSSVQVKEDSSETVLRAVPASASSVPRAGKGGKSIAVGTVMAGSPDPTVRCRGSQQSKLAVFDGWDIELRIGEGDGDREGQEMLAGKNSGRSSWVVTLDAGAEVEAE